MQFCSLFLTVFLLVCLLYTRKRFNLQSEMLPFTYLYQFSLYLMECYLSSASVCYHKLYFWSLLSTAWWLLEIWIYYLWLCETEQKMEYLKTLNMNMWICKNRREYMKMDRVEDQHCPLSLWEVMPHSFSVVYSCSARWGLVFSAYTQNLTGIFLSQLKA